VHNTHDSILNVFMNYFEST